MQALPLLFATAFAQTVDFGTDEAMVSFGLGSNFGTVTQLKRKGQDLLGDGSKDALWSATLVAGQGGQQHIDSNTKAVTSHKISTDKTTLTLSWSNMEVYNTHVNTTVTVTSTGSSLSFSLSFDSTGEVSLWGWQFTISEVKLYPASFMLENHGFGILHACSSTDPTRTIEREQGNDCKFKKIENSYIPMCARGVGYCQTHGSLEAAQNSCKKQAGCSGITRTRRGYELRGGDSAEGSRDETSWIAQGCHKEVSEPVACGQFGNDYPQATYQFVSAYDSSLPDSGIYLAAHDGTGASKHFQADVSQYSNPSTTLSISATASDAGLPLKHHVVEYPLVLATFDGDWYDSTQIYRSWALNNAGWTKKGPVAMRPDVPKWLNNVTTWVNSHWQGNDIFNTSGGDPEVVKNRVMALKERFNLGKAEMGLHWYEWDLLGYEAGSNYTKCGSEITCGFDTHYPEYFPTRQGFSENLKTMQQNGIRVTPYINGRIFDISTKTWTKDGAVKYAAKQAYPQMNPTQGSLSTYFESYGSEAQFNVMCPHTDYWQDIISNVTAKIVNELGTDGVYLDQIASAGPKPCWDDSHGHTLGGGSHWSSGYQAMLQKARTKSGNNAVLLTESNAEPFMDGVTIYLTLVGYSSAPFEGERKLVNAFGAIYGGYYYSMGAEFFQQDFTPNPDVFSAKLAKMLLFGSQLGWFSMGGRNNQNPPMGIIEYLLDDQYTPEIQYLKALSDAKLLSNPWTTDGRPTRDLVLKTTSTRVQVAGHPRTSRNVTSEFKSGLSSTSLGMDYDPVMSACFTSPSSSLLCMITSVNRQGDHDFSFTLTPSKFNLPAGTVKLTNLATGELLNTFTGDVSYSGKIASHTVLLLKMEV
eukprot:TRINITY_DN18489_c2_g1_i2.p1 TRINITY_DN18489_c2_g1~~TRINITY_DN18489_c2_g1_i2.p1  ORF type:complete len:866 (+),score=204.82 TRINITY_DN18489_c2_g1_i2:107-2704(+)